MELEPRAKPTNINTSMAAQFSLKQLYKHGDQIMVTVIWLHFGACLALASLYDTWSAVYSYGLIAAIVPTATLAFFAGTVISRTSVAISFMVFSALAIHQTHGMIETHFGIFCLLAFLAFYRDWIPIVVAAGVIAVHHLAFHFMQANGYPVYVFPSTEHGIGIVLIHAAYVVLESAILIYMAIIGQREAVRTEELYEIGAHLQVIDQEIDLTYRKPNPKSRFAVGFNKFIEEIHRLVTNTRQTALSVASASGNLESITNHTTDGVVQQNQETDQVATAINEMTATTQQVAQNAADAARAAEEASENALKGQDVVNKTIDVIRSVDEQIQNASSVITELSGASEQIGNVMVVIKGIAEQTNLLALNAAIEAARAGEQGRGFAVVADEVRNLASRTQKSTQEIEDMIERLQTGSNNAVEAMNKSRERSAEGVEQARAAGQALEVIAHAIASINDMNTQIATAAEEQTAVSDEINKNVVSIRDISQQTADGAKHVRTSTNELTELSSQLQKMLNRFKV